MIDNENKRNRKAVGEEEVATSIMRLKEAFVLRPIRSDHQPTAVKDSVQELVSH